MRNKSIKKLIYIESFTNFDTLINSIRVVFILSFVLSKDIVAINKFAMMAAIFLFEVPSGFFSDKYGDKKTFLIAKLFAIISLVFMILFRNEIGFISSFVLLGLSGAFESGAKNSFYRRICKFHNIDYKNIKINISQKANILKLGLSIVGSILYAYNIYLPFLITLGLYIISFISLLIMPDDGEKRQVKHENLFKGTKILFYEIVKDKNFFIELIVYTFATSLLILSFDYYQLFFKSYHVPLYFFGTIYASFRLLAYFGVSLYKKNFNKNLSIILISFSFILIYFQNIYLFVLAVILQEIFFSFENTRFDILLIDQLEEKNQGAHFESIISLIYSIFRIVILFTTALALNYLTLHTFFFICSLVIIALFIFRKIIGYREVKIV